MDDLKGSMTNIETGQRVHGHCEKICCLSRHGNHAKKSAIQLNVETNLAETLQDIQRMDDLRYKYLGFERKKGEVDRKEMLVKLEERIKKSWRSLQGEWKHLRRGTGSSMSTRI